MKQIILTSIDNFFSEEKYWNDERVVWIINEFIAMIISLKLLFCYSNSDGYTIMEKISNFKYILSE
jgi:hypothetical protein